MFQRKEKVIQLGGEKYKIPKAKPRPTMKALKKKGFVSIVENLERDYKWIEAFAEKWSTNPQLQKPTEDSIAGIRINTAIGVTLVSVERISPKKKQVYLLECYNLEEADPELRFLVDISGTKAIYHLVDFYKMDILDERQQKDSANSAAAVVSVIFLATKLYANVTKYRIFDCETFKEGNREITVKPILAFGEDILLKSSSNE